LHQQRDPSIALDVPHASEITDVDDRLGLLVERCPDDVIDDDEADGDEPRPAIGRDRGQRRRARVGEERLLCVGQDGGPSAVGRSLTNSNPNRPFTQR
jgi:hypothetical protein